MPRNISYTVKNGIELTANVDFSIVRWDSNDRVPPQATLQDMLQQHLITKQEYDTSITVGQDEIDELLSSYRENHRSTAEERSMTSAAHGSGVKVTNIITGESCITQ